jgi:hypothetical protein
LNVVVVKNTVKSMSVVVDTMVKGVKTTNLTKNYYT